MLQGNIIVIRVKGGNITSVVTNLPQVSVVIIDEDQAAVGEEAVLYPSNEFKTGEDLNTEMTEAGG